MDKRTKKKVGCPPKYHPDLCSIAFDKLSEGASMVEVGAAVGVFRGTLYDWMKVHPEFGDAITQGKERCEAWWTELGRKKLEEPKFNTTLWIINMKNRFGWERKYYSKSTDFVSSLGDLNLKSLSKEQILQLIKDNTTNDEDI